MFNLKQHLLMAVVMVALGLPLLHCGAQEKKSERPGREANGGFTGGLRAAPLARLMEVLTDEQRSSLQDAMAGEREKVRELEEKSRDLRREIFEASTIDKFDEAKVRKAAEDLGKAEAELTVLRAKAFSRMRPPLSAEQIQKLRELGVGAPSRSGNQDETPQRRRPEIPRDENGLPLKQK